MCENCNRFPLCTGLPLKYFIEFVSRNEHQATCFAEHVVKHLYSSVIWNVLLSIVVVVVVVVSVAAAVVVFYLILCKI